MIQTDHDSLKHFRHQDKLNKLHAKWIEFLEILPYVLIQKEKEEYGRRCLVMKVCFDFHIVFYIDLFWILEVLYLEDHKFSPIFKDYEE